LSTLPAFLAVAVATLQKVGLIASATLLHVALINAAVATLSVPVLQPLVRFYVPLA
jgi:hypothetical protein